MTRAMTTQEARKILKEKAGLEEQTLVFLECYKYADDLLTKLAAAIQG